MVRATQAIDPCPLGPGLIRLNGRHVGSPLWMSLQTASMNAPAGRPARRSPANRSGDSEAPDCLLSLTRDHRCRVPEMPAEGAAPSLPPNRVPEVPETTGERRF